MFAGLLVLHLSRLFRQIQSNMGETSLSFLRDIISQMICWSYHSLSSSAHLSAVFVTLDTGDAVVCFADPSIGAGTPKTTCSLHFD